MRQFGSLYLLLFLGTIFRKKLLHMKNQDLPFELNSKYSPNYFLFNLDNDFLYTTDVYNVDEIYRRFNKEILFKTQENAFKRSLLEKNEGLKIYFRLGIPLSLCFYFRIKFFLTFLIESFLKNRPIFSTSLFLGVITLLFFLLEFLKRFLKILIY